MNNLLEQQLSILRQKSYCELSQLESYCGEKAYIGGKSISIGIWKNVKSNERIEIVVQIYKPWFLGIGRMTAKGFRVGKNGDVEELSDEDLYEFT